VKLYDVKSGSQPASLYLDQKDWIALARVRASKPNSEELRETAVALATHVDEGRLVLPLSQSHIVETGFRSDPTDRLAVAETMVVLSQRNALAPIQRLCTQEADAFLRRQFGAVVDVEPEPFGRGVAFALGLTDLVSVPSDAPEAEIAMAEIYAISEPWRTGLSQADLERRGRWDKWVESANALAQRLIKDRNKFNEQDRLAAVTFHMLGQLGHSLLDRAIALDVHEQLLKFLRDEGFWAAIREMPALAVLTELQRVRYPDVESAWTTRDYHDVRFLAVALAYCSAVSADRQWGSLAQRSEYIVNRGALITMGKDAIRSALDQMERTWDKGAP
jgi:hypothetical protein